VRTPEFNFGCVTLHLGGAARRIHDTWMALRAAPSNGEETPSVLLCIYVPSENLTTGTTVFDMVGSHTASMGVTLTALNAISVQT
jgi:hypothetical protein